MCPCALYFSEENAFKAIFISRCTTENEIKTCSTNGVIILRIKMRIKKDITYNLICYIAWIDYDKTSIYSSRENRYVK